MKVELINYTQDALELLIYTKNTRLQGGVTIEEIKEWPMQKKLDHLAYMKDTIQSSWEFVDYTFEISGVTRAFTHQLVRTRTGKYAQESQRTVDVRDHEVIVKDDVQLNNMTRIIMNMYGTLIDIGYEVQDARGILPTNISTSIIAKFDLRTLHNMGLLRLCTRTQGEYQEVFKEMKKQVIKVHPWANDFIKVKCAWDGVCAFPRYDKCPIQKYTIQADKHTLQKIEYEWRNTDHVANPVAKDGKTQ